MADLRDHILSALMRTYNDDPERYTFVSSILSELSIPYDASVGEIFISLQKEGLIDVLSTTNIRIRLTRKGAENA